MEYIISRVKQHFLSVSLASVVKEAFFIVLFFVFIGLVFTKVVNAYVSVNRPFVNLSYFIIPFFLYRWPMFIASIILVIMDFMFSVSLSGMSAPAMLGLLRQLPEAGFFGVKILVFVICVISILAYVSFLVFKRASLLAVFFSILVVFISCMLWRQLTSSPISNYGMPGLFIKHWLGMSVDEFTYKRITDWNTTYSRIKGGSFLRNEIMHGDAKVISIVLESFGVPLNKKLNLFFEWKLHQSLEERFSGFSLTEFQGSTINAEIRELCSLNMYGLIVQSIPDAENCIPHQLTKNGYKTYAYHNNSGRFYDRFIWYKDIGFSSFVDGGRLRQMGHYSPSRVFSGVDDLSVMNEIVTDLDGKEKYFAYWVTMDTHAPYADYNDDNKKANSFECGRFSISSKYECNYLKLLNGTLDVIVELAKKLPDAKIVVSGDHMPRFFDVANPQVVKMLNSHYDDKHVLSFVISPQK